MCILRRYYTDGSSFLTYTHGSTLFDCIIVHCINHSLIKENSTERQTEDQNRNSKKNIYAKKNKSLFFHASSTMNLNTRAKLLLKICTCSLGIVSYN